MRYIHIHTHTHIHHTIKRWWFALRVNNETKKNLLYNFIQLIFVHQTNKVDLKPRWRILNNIFGFLLFWFGRLIAGYICACNSVFWPLFLLNKIFSFFFCYFVQLIINFFICGILSYNTVHTSNPVFYVGD